MEVPFILFRTPRGEFAVDAYFVEFVSLEPRKVTLIKDASRERFYQTAQDPLPVLLKDDIARFLASLFATLEERSNELRGKRVSHMRRWNFWRILGVPTGHHRHVARDEMLAELEREYGFALALLRTVTGAKTADDIETLGIESRGVAYRRLWLKEGVIFSDSGKDRVYTNLLSMDPFFRTAFYSALFRRVLLNEEIEEKAQAFP